MKKSTLLLALLALLFLSGCNKKEEFYCKIISPSDGATVPFDDGLGVYSGLTIAIDAKTGKGTIETIEVFVSDPPYVIGGNGWSRCGYMSMNPNTFTISPMRLFYGKMRVKIIARNSEGEETSHSIMVDVSDKAALEESPDFATFSNGEMPKGWFTNLTWEIEKQLGYDDDYSMRAASFNRRIIYAVKTFDKDGYVDFFTKGKDVFLEIDGEFRNALSSEPAENYWTKHTYSVSKGKHLFMWEAIDVYTYLDAIRFYEEELTLQ